MKTTNEKLWQIEQTNADNQRVTQLQQNHQDECDDALLRLIQKHKHTFAKTGEKLKTLLSAENLNMEAILQYCAELEALRKQMKDWNREIVVVDKRDPNLL